MIQAIRPFRLTIIAGLALLVSGCASNFAAPVIFRDAPAPVARGGTTLAVRTASVNAESGAYSAPEPARRNLPPAVEVRELDAGSGTSGVFQTASALPSGTAGAMMTAPAAAPNSRVVRVRAGDTLGAIAADAGVPVAVIASGNNLRPPYILRVGQELTIPVLRRHVVRPGETLYAISRVYGVELRELAALNGLAEPYRLAAGNRLSVPAPAGQIQPIAPAAPAREVQVASLSGMPGGTDVAELPAPDGGAVSREPVPGPALAALPTAAGMSSTTDPVPLPVVKPVAQAPAKALRAPADPAVIEAALRSPPPLSARRFAWPVQGKVISRYGAKKNGLHNDGINISADAGTPILAAENGVVAYSGNEIRGFGNMLLIRHADGYTTAYAHAGELLVNRGDRVTRGQVIGRVGATGSVSRPQLHFEVRKGVTAVDPAAILDRSS
ncbi:peptidoglycan DD-metalloendopeptidase family protein [Oceanibacterium hippocampi]|uniref:Murein hydrolase activator NlpD n=1 Tax=Oceanibacterium hippocampi TaxID=745714 RepID=A0A1Y5U2R6_9PROT|nr:peptidoglycan DD-metalloendopeptidase family protein [Oceanibacterium hippocampi]SLN77200.1 Murein hydrolase activator NlpD precursor [Oceanibacterium hippocampi]